MPDVDDGKAADNQHRVETGEKEKDVVEDNSTPDEPPEPDLAPQVEIT